MTAAQKTKTRIWDVARKITLGRVSPCGLYNEPLEKGVNYFVLMLEQLGAVTHYSCEGHPHSPNNFYIVFAAPLSVAQKIVECGYFTVELEGKGIWSLRTRNITSDIDRRNFLRAAADAWERKLGPLTALAGVSE